MTCDFDGCPRESYAKGLCDAHYRQQRQGKPLTPVAPTPRKLKRKTPAPVCSFEGCGRAHRSDTGLCAAHRKQLERGRPLAPLQVRKKPKEPEPAWVPGTLWREIEYGGRRASGYETAFVNKGGIIPETKVEIPDTTKAAMRRVLQAHGGTDLADMLGVAS